MTYMHKFRETANRHVKSSYEMDEVINVTLEFFLATDDDKIILIYSKDGINGVVKYICKTIKTQATSTRSRYYYKTKRENALHRTDLKSYVDDAGNLIKPLENLAIEDDGVTTAQLLTELDVILENDISFYLAKLFRMNKIDKMSMQSISDLTGIGMNEVFKAITKATKQIKLAAFIRQQKEDKLNDYGIMTQEQYNVKWNINQLPEDYIPKQLLLDVLEDNDNDFTTSAHKLNVPYGRLNKYINLHKIK